MNYLPVNETSLEKAAEIIRSGGLVAFPTETVYGLGADAYNPSALAKVFDVKNRPFFDPLIIHIAAVETLDTAADLVILSGEKRKILFLLIENFWPGPLSIILPKSSKIPGLATAGLSNAAFRFPDHPAAQKLISLSTGAIAAPSANPFGSLSPTKAQHVKDKLGDKIDMILDGGQTQIGLESTVLDITSEKIKILRHGGTTKEAIEKIIGSVIDSNDKIDGETSGGLASPGQLKNHYAPLTALTLFDDDGIYYVPFESDTGYLFFDDLSCNVWIKKEQERRRSKLIKVLSASGQMQEAASCFFETLHDLDNMGVSKIYAQLAPHHGLGVAINDRLQRASSNI